MFTTLTIPLQLMCQLVNPANIQSENTTFGGPVIGQTIDLPTGFTAFPKIGMAYKYFDDVVPWNEARKTCIAYGSSLAMIDSFQKCDAVHTLRANPTIGAFVGIHKLFGNGEWVSIKTGLPVTVIPWETDADKSNTEKDCVIIRNHGQGLFPVPCSNVQDFFCEIPLVN